jgi:hypothetical protein
MQAAFPSRPKGSKVTMMPEIKGCNQIKGCNPVELFQTVLQDWYRSVPKVPES